MYFYPLLRKQFTSIINMWTLLFFPFFFNSSLLWDVFVINIVEQLQTLPKTQSEIDISPFLKTQKPSILYYIIIEHRYPIWGPPFFLFFFLFIIFVGRFHYKQCWTTSNITKNSIRDRYKPISKNTKTLDPLFFLSIFYCLNNDKRIRHKFFN